MRHFNVSTAYEVTIEMIRPIIGGNKASFNDRYEAFFIDYSLTPLLIQQNYIDSGDDDDEYDEYDDDCDDHHDHDDHNDDDKYDDGHDHDDEYDDYQDDDDHEYDDDNDDDDN